MLQGGTVSDESDEDLIADELTMSDDDLAHISPAAIAIVLRRWSELDDETKNEIRTILKATEVATAPAAILEQARATAKEEAAPVRATAIPSAICHSRLPNLIVS